MPYQREEELEREFGLLIALMADMITAQATQHDPKAEVPGWMFSQHDLAKKLFRHMCSARTLLEPSPFQNQTFPSRSFIDHSSIAVLTRSSLENYLVMTWLLSGGNQSLQEFRHNVWEYCGWKKRSKMAATTNDARTVRQAAEDDAVALWPEIQGSPHFQNYTEAQQKSLRKGDWGVGWNWNDLALEAGLHRTYFTSIYPFLSGHVHSDFIGAIQNGQANNLQDQYMLGSGHLMVIVMLLGHFAHHYAGVFPPARNVLHGAGEARVIAEKWNLRADDMDFLYQPRE
ncbi:DUF5677 domain-containing protein [Pseudomonas sp. B21-021]|jgi:hypothetical protein|uniref:DUF5677 domain-containing protein n=1 Tax=Pseudomonas sp. B21-021 TaxID=2895476 RepID=UPI00215E98F3|nr:DUF5677 domain-containing protein [Pseudomonas sp. B21-021]UVM27782.1 DUF5677 domain-containing protein [Pseudomonas sp. B21-021]